ncbi:hypothetical protein CSKR_114155 [Clonorchis sinensis]|uniref:Uncharacterized protein n=1 Tax=Clonorchis sinensis TaxID=79923 RepID=A0A419Q5J5_CLOSI|nr:hypothetical protein CSKR_114155 [Clonorchis sinensis]
MVNYGQSIRLSMKVAVPSSQGRTWVRGQPVHEHLGKLQSREVVEVNDDDYRYHDDRLMMYSTYEQLDNSLEQLMCWVQFRDRMSAYLPGYRQNYRKFSPHRHMNMDNAIGVRGERASCTIRCETLIEKHQAITNRLYVYIHVAVWRKIPVALMVARQICGHSVLFGFMRLFRSTPYLEGHCYIQDTLVLRIEDAANFANVALSYELIWLNGTRYSTKELCCTCCRRFVRSIHPKRIKSHAQDCIYCLLPDLWIAQVHKY